jgi:hypothetical protein
MSEISRTDFTILTDKMVGEGVLALMDFDWDSSDPDPEETVRKIYLAMVKAQPKKTIRKPKFDRAKYQREYMRKYRHTRLKDGKA